MIDWNCARRIRKHNLNGTTILGQVRGGSVLILTQAFSFKYKMFSVCFLSLFHAPFLTGTFFLYSPILLNPSLPPVNSVNDILDAYPIRTFLEYWCVAVRLNITV